MKLPNILQHVVQRGNKRQPIFFHEEDYSLFLEYLRELFKIEACKDVF